MTIITGPELRKSLEACSCGEGQENLEIGMLPSLHDPERADTVLCRIKCPACGYSNVCDIHVAATYWKIKQARRRELEAIV